MPPHLHPRSTATSTLFAGTLLASFTVVAIPHIFPCPRPRRAYADAERPVQLDSDGRPIRRKRRKNDGLETSERPKDLSGPDPSPATATAEAGSTLSATTRGTEPRLPDEAALFRQFQQEAEMLEKEARECPVPKPGAVLGRLFGFQQGEKDAQREGGSSANDVR